MLALNLAAVGLSTTLRDLVRFGEAMRCDGAFNGQQIVPAAGGGGHPPGRQHGAHFCERRLRRYLVLPQHVVGVARRASVRFTARGISRPVDLDRPGPPRW